MDLTKFYISDIEKNMIVINECKIFAILENALFENSI